MQGNLSHFAHAPSNSVSLGNNHGYRFEGDIAILNAELDVAPDSADNARQHWALQLWACESPHQGGPLCGLKVAEAELALASLVNEGPHEATRLETAAFAQLPARHGEYAMVMVLASGDQGRYDQVHDFSNYAVRQQFSGPSLEGNVGYRLQDDSVILQAEAVRNARAVDNLSGTLDLQLWAMRESYQGGQVHGTLLAHASLGRLSGQEELRSLERRVPLAELAPGEWQLALLLSEWTDAAGFITRDYCNFATSHRVEAARAVESVALQAEAGALESVAPNAQAAAGEPVRNELPVSSAPTVSSAPAVVSPASEPKIALKALSVVAAPRPASVAARAEQSPAEKPSAAKPSAAKQPSATPLATQAPRADTLREAAPAAPRSAVVASAASAPSKGRLSLQTATVDELAGVEGLNRKLAQAIVKARPFNTLEDVVRVRGIGDKLLQKLRDKLTL